MPAGRWSPMAAAESGATVATAAFETPSIAAAMWTV